jgi:L-fucose dehydrogenase
MDLGLQDKTIVITGGASGIGAAITRMCLQEGARVVILSRISPGVPEFLREQRAANALCEMIELDVSDAEACRQAIAQVVEQHGGIYALVNNAAVNDGVGLEHGTLDGFLNSLHTNLVPAYVLTQAALPALKASRGAVVNIGSKVALTGQGSTSGYAAAKGGILGLTREWAAELLPYGIRVNAVIPAEVKTPAYDTWLQTLQDPATTLRKIEAQIPLDHRMTTPDEIAAAVLLLLSPVHSAHTTGQWLHIDGGYVHLDRALTAAPILKREGE